MTPTPTPDQPVEPVFSALRIAELMAERPEEVKPPTPEQQRVIEHPLQGTALVIAGAGSGKTETIANRVVWLVANGLVEPEAVLGLTFTRKAAGELAERIQRRLERFRERLHEELESGRLNPLETQRAKQLEKENEENLLLPEVSTYDAYAASIVQEFGALAGVASELTLIDSAAAWGIARETVIASSDPELTHSHLQISKLADYVVTLDQTIADNQTSAERVERVAQEFLRVAELPRSVKEPDGKPYASLRTVLESVTTTALIARLARDFSQRKQQLKVAQFSDQLKLALDIVTQSPEAVARLKERSRVVLLDEMQDTSVAQGRLLSQIFRGEAVMAVGDPHQSIYGWRGASADGMSAFHHLFRSPDKSADEHTLSLSVSWRNAQRILHAANIVSQPLRAHSRIHVPTLSPAPHAQTGEVVCEFSETLREEQEKLADWMVNRLEQHRQQHGTHATAAVIMRSRAPMEGFAKALRARGVPAVIVGVGGLLRTPEVTDLVATLKCLWYADATSELIRLLAGPRFRIGVADLAGLRQTARWFERRDITQRRLTDVDLTEDIVLKHPDRRFTIVDALDELCTMKDLQHRSLEHISPEGRERLREAGLMLRRLRQRISDGIPSLIRDIELELRLDIELEAAEHRAHTHTADARANLDAFMNEVESFLSIDEHGTIDSVIRWLDRAESDNEAAEYVPEPTPGTVQIITVHGSKGLEWNIVAIPRLVAHELPKSPKTTKGWLSSAVLPDELRGDRASRPELRWRLATTQQELSSDITEYSASIRDQHLEEERRLMYVAMTRAASSLYLSGAFWSGLTRPRMPSEYLNELAEANLIEAPAQESQHAEDPDTSEATTLQWPLDALGSRAPAVLRAAQQVRDELTHRTLNPAENKPAKAGLDETRGPTEQPHEPTEQPHEPNIDPVVLMLLKERSARAEHAAPAAAREKLAERLTASTFHEFIEDPVLAERNRLRPLPQRPYRRTRVGNQFHDWVERRTTTQQGKTLPLKGLESEHFDELGYQIEPEFAETDASELAHLQRQFEQSRFAQRQPEAVELEISIPFAGRRLVCKLDAVYRLNTHESENADRYEEARYEIVDWKSGTPPRTADERQTRLLQLELYRHAYAQWAQISPQQIDVSLFYVADGIELTSDTPMSLEELEELWQAAAAQASSQNQELDIAPDERP